jgi:hypothetical protein
MSAHRALARLRPLARFSALVALLVLAACAGGAPAAPPAPAALDPVGLWRGETSANGERTTVEIEIRGMPGAYTGVLTTSALPPVPFDRITITDQTVRLVGSIMGELLSVTMVVTGEEFTADWSAAGMVGSMAGTRAAR